MVLSSDGRTGATGKTVTVTICKGATGGFAAPAGTVSELSNGWYKIALTNVDTNMAGDLAYHCTAADSDATDFSDEVITEAQASSRPVGTTSDFTLTRNQLVTKALKKVRAVAQEENPTPTQLTEGIHALNLIVREEDADGKHLWAYSSTPSTVTLLQDIGVYTTSQGLPNNIVELTSVSYRNSSGVDCPVQILTHAQYEAISNKFDRGDTEKIFLTHDRVLASRSLYVWPLPNNINTQSEVIGTDALNYRCIRSHTAVADNKPVTGANYLLFWEQGGSSGATWVSGTSYSAPQLLRIWYKRPLADFDAANDDPDMPTSWTRKLLYELATDLADDYGLALEERAVLSTKAGRADERTFAQTQVEKTTDTHDKAVYF